MNAQGEAVQQQQIEKAADVPGLPIEKTSSLSPVPPQATVSSMPKKDIVIKRATFGDETSSTDVTKTLTDQLINNDGYIDTTADQSLIPIVTWFGGGEGTTRLSRAEEREAQQKAQDDCGGGQNKSCVEVRKQQYSQAKLKEKAQKSVAADKVVKGRRLTVTYIDESGREQTSIVPDGNDFKVGTPTADSNPFSTNAILWKLLYISSTLIVVIGWVYSVTATYRTFLQAGYRWIGYAATAASIFIPYSGFFIMFGFFLFTTLVTKKPAAIAAYVPKTIESIAKRPGATVSSVISQ